MPGDTSAADNLGGMMVESIRSARVLVEVDTNKQTYTLDEHDVALDEVETLVSEFLERCGQ